MNFVKLGDMKLCPVVLGTDVYGTYVDEATSFSLLDYYIGNGGNVLDTANIYGFRSPSECGYSEKLIGKWLKDKKRDNIIISTKGGHPNPDTMHISRLSRDEIFSDMDESLKRLNTDYVDIYWLHRDDESIPVCEIADTLDELIKQGKTRYVGLSNWTYKRIDEFNKYAEKNSIAKVIASQLQYSPAIANIENNEPTLVLMNKDEYSYFKDANMAVFGYASQAKGFFSKMYNGGENALSIKARERYFNEETLDVYKSLKRIAESYGKSIGETVISALVSNSDFKTVAIVGCKNTEQLKDTMGGCSFNLKDSEVSEILRFYKKTAEL